MVKIVFDWPFTGEIYSVEYEHENIVAYPEGVEEKVRVAADIIGNLLNFLSRDEVEILKVDHETKTIKLLFKSPKILKKIRRDMNEMDERRRAWYSYRPYVPKRIKKPLFYFPSSNKKPFWTEVGDIRKDYL